MLLRKSNGQRDERGDNENRDFKDASQEDCPPLCLHLDHRCVGLPGLPRRLSGPRQPCPRRGCGTELVTGYPYRGHRTVPGGVHEKGESVCLELVGWITGLADKVRRPVFSAARKGP